MSGRSPAIAALTVTLLAAGLAGAWRTDVAGTPSPSRPDDVTTLADGTPVAVGRIRVDGVQNDAIAVAFDAATGAERWRHVAAGTNTAANDLYRRVVRGPGGSIVAGGRVQNLTTGADALVTRLAADGTVLWEVQRDGGQNLTDDVQDLAVLGAGDVIVVGRLEAGISFGAFAVWRLDGTTGNVVWTRHLDAPGGRGRRVVLSGDAAYVVGETDATGANDDVLVARVAVADGTVAWTTTVGGDAGIDDAAIGIGFDGGQVTVLAQVAQVATSGDGLVLALSAGSGNENWRTLLDGAAAGADEVAGLAMAPNGDALVTGSMANVGTADDLMVARIAAADGGIVWRTERDGGNEANDEGTGIAFAAIAASDAVFVTGRLREPGVAGEIAALRLDAATGSVAWQRAIEGGADRNDIGIAIAADAAGDVVIAGRARQDATGDEFAVIKLSSASGGSFPCGNGVIDPGEDCDDANPIAGDGCRRDCTVEVCGDGIVDPTEDCDDPLNACCTEACFFPPPDTACDDGDACTQTDLCTAGVCAGTDPVTCPTPGQCETVACDPADGQCLVTPRADATLCTDANACTRGDQCLSGTCVSGVPEICDDFEPCTIDACDPLVGCTFTPFTGIPSVACAVDRPRIDTQCGLDVPRAIARRIEKTERLLEKADATEASRRLRRLLRKVARTARKAGKKSGRLRDNGRLPLVCGETLVRVFADVEARALAARDAVP